MKSVKRKKVSLPLFVLINKRLRKKWLTLNQYNQWHYQTKSNCKIKFKTDIMHLLDFKIEGEVKIQYDYYAPDKRKRDLMNVVSVVDKFFQDALVEGGCIEDDNVSIVKQVNCRYIEIDKQNPRLEATIIKL